MACPVAMKRCVGPVLAVLVAGCVGSVGACSSGVGDSSGVSQPVTSSSTSKPPRTRQPDESEGAFIFRTQCGACHGPDAKGNIGPSLVGIAQRMDEATQTAKVRDGAGLMPAFDTVLTPDEIAEVVTYTRTEL